MAEDLGDARLALSTDDSELDRGLAAAEAKSRSFLERVGSSTKAAFKVVAVAVATGLAAATVQGAQLNQVLNDLQAETGATGDDWEAMQAVVRRENGRTTASIDEIGAATKAMRQDLNLTGADIDKYADKFFDAALVTKASGEQIVKTTDDIADGYNVSVDRAVGSIDQIIASQEKWGGSIQDRLAVLPTLAKGIKALNGNVDDGIALLNLASASGLEYADVQKAINQAVTKFAVPRSLQQIIGLQDLHKTKVALATEEVQKLEDELAKFVVPARLREIVATLSGIEEPTARAAAAERIYNDEVAKFNADPIQRYLEILGDIPDAQTRTTRAIELFGPKAGPVWAQLAEAVHKAGGNLDSFNVTQDQAGDKATEVAGKINSGPVRALKLLGERLGALLADAGSNPLVTGIASFGTILGGFAPNLSGKIAGGIIDGVKGAWAKVAASSAVKAVVGVAADKAATVYLKALFAGDIITGALQGAWAKVLGSSVIQAVIKRAGTTAAAAYLVALITGDAIGSALSGAWAATGGKVVAAASASGALSGTAFAAAAASAIAAAPIIVIGVAFKVVDDLKPDVSGGVEDQFKARLDAAASGTLVMVDAGADAGTAYVDSAGKAVATKLGPAINDGLERAHPGIAAAAARIATTASTVVSSVVTSSIGHMGPNWSVVARAQANRAGAAVAQGIHDSIALTEQAWTDLLDALKHVETPAARAARLAGRLASKALAKGMDDERPEVRARAQAVFQSTIDELGKIVAEGGKIGKKGMDFLQRAMRSGNPEIKAAAQSIYAAATKKISTIPAKMDDYGHAAGAAYAAGLRSTWGLVNDAANYVARGAVGPFRASSPPGPESPLHLIDVWGSRTGRAWIEPFAAAIIRGRAGLVAAVAGVGDAISSRRFPSLVASLTAAPAMATTGSGAATAPGTQLDRALDDRPTTISKTYVQNVRMDAAPKARDPLGVARALGKFARTGVLEREYGEDE